MDEMRGPACEGSPADERKGAHDPHGYWTRHWGAWAECPGWTRCEADATELAGQLSQIAREAMWPAALPPGIRLECHPFASHALRQLFIPSLNDFTASLATGEDMMRPQIPLVVTAGLGRGQWRITAGGGLIAEGTVRDG